MALEPSILKSTKKLLGLDANYNAFDTDIITHINTTFFTLNQLGVGPTEGFMIEDDSAVWYDFTFGILNLNAVRSYVYLSVCLAFDPPSASHHLKAYEDQIDELAYRLSLERELNVWSPPGSSENEGEIIK